MRYASTVIKHSHGRTTSRSIFGPCIWWQEKLCNESTLNEPTHEIIALIALCKLHLQTRMRSHPMGLHVCFLVRSFVYLYTLCVRTAKALARLRVCTGSPEPSLVAYVISTIISWAGSNLATSRERLRPGNCSSIRNVMWSHIMSYNNFRWQNFDEMKEQFYLSSCFRTKFYQKIWL